MRQWISSKLFTLYKINDFISLRQRKVPSLTRLWALPNETSNSCAISLKL